MAQRVEVMLIDDVDGSEAAETVSFGLDGHEYEIDVSADKSEQMREALSYWIGFARRVGVRPGTSRRSTTSGTRTTADKDELAALRAWAKENDLQVSDRGRISKEVREAYERSQQQEKVPAGTAEVIAEQKETKVRKSRAKIAPEATFEQGSQSEE